MRNLLFFIFIAIVILTGSCTQDNVHMPETTTDTIMVTKYDTVRITDENISLYLGVNEVSVAGMLYTATILYKVTKNDDNTLDVVVPEYELKATVMGDLTIGSYTIKGLTYSEEKSGYYKDYSNDGLTMHLKAESGGTTTMDGDYPLSSSGTTLLVQYTDAVTAKIDNRFQPGAMPFPIIATFTGKQQ